MFTSSLPYIHFFHFSDTYSLGSNGSTKFLESLLSLIPFERAGPVLVLECYVMRCCFTDTCSLFFLKQEEVYSNVKLHNNKRLSTSDF
jgi:hypothetical protein